MAEIASGLSPKARYMVIGYRVVGIGFYHLAALAAFAPYFFTWAGVAAAVLGYFLIALLGINVCYHRLLAHRGVTCSKPVERVLATLGVLNLQLGPAYWVAIHRRHHQFADGPQDPHSPRPAHGGFFKAHVGWIFTIDPNTDPSLVTKRYAKDLLADPYYAWLEKNEMWFWGTVVPSWAVFFLFGFLGELLAGGATKEAVRVGLSVLVWGVFVRTVAIWHFTWAVNSICHIWGYRTHDTRDDSRNNLLVGVVSAGEGWHNNHHADPVSPRHGHQWWEFDLTWQAIRLLAALRLVKFRRAAAMTPDPEGS